MLGLLLCNFCLIPMVLIGGSVEKCVCCNAILRMGARDLKLITFRKETVVATPC